MSDDDLISRQEAIEMVQNLTQWYKERYHETRPTPEAVIEGLRFLPTKSVGVVAKFYHIPEEENEF